MGRIAGCSITLAAGLLLAACSSGGSHGKQIPFGTPAVQIAKQLGICANPQRVPGAGARCVFLDGQIVAVNSIPGPADQQLEIPAARAGIFCELVGHGFGVTGLSYSDLFAHVRVNALVAQYGGRIVGGGC